jgi:TRAP-type transport system periplasmic protein
MVGSLMALVLRRYLAARVPERAVLDLPFTFDRRDRAHALLDGALGARLADRVAAATGYRVLGYSDNGFRHLTNRVRPIRTPGDCRGLRMRILASELHRAVFDRLGFEPVVLDVRELLAAVRAGTIDAQDNSLTNIYNFEIYRHHRHVTLTGHFFANEVARLTPAERAVFAAAVAPVVAEMRERFGAEVLDALADA